MAFRAIRVALLLSSLPLAGCGTVTNLVNQKPGAGGVRPFGGVRHDVSCIQKTASEEADAKVHSQAEHDRQMARMCLYAADLPLSLLGDIVTWPYTAAYTYINEPVPVPPVIIVPTASQSQGPSGVPLPEPRKLPLSPLDNLFRDLFSVADPGTRGQC